MSVAVVAAVAAGLAVWWALRPSPWSRLRAAPNPRAGAGSRWGPWWAAVQQRLPEGRAARRRREGLEASVSEVCGLLAVCVEAGTPPRSALAIMAETVAEPAASELAKVGQRIALGVEERLAWQSLADVPGYRAVARDVARAVEQGTGIAEQLRRHAAEARREAVALAQARARTAGVHSVIPLMVCFLPAFLLLGVVPVLASVLGHALG